jgi:hypothetical protein
MLRDSKTQADSDGSNEAKRANHALRAKCVCRLGILSVLICCLVQPGWGYSGGLGSRQVPFLIATADDLIELHQNPADNDKHFVLTRDIDLSAYTFNQAVIAPQSVPVDTSSRGDDRNVFSGTINGNGHLIRNLTISGMYNLGLIGASGAYAQIYGIGVQDANIVGTGDAVGMLVGYNAGQISNCYSMGTVQGRTEVGGLAGANRGLITSSHSAGEVSGTSTLGGLAGDGGLGRIVNSYSTCVIQTVSAESALWIGGVLGSGLAEDSFWDVEVSGVTEGTGTGLNTEKMQDINTYLDAGWDFLGESSNGCRETWSMTEANAYPVLSVFHGFAPPLPAGCGVTLGQCTLPLDANEVMWDSSSVFSSKWSSVALTSIRQNQLKHPEQAANAKDSILSISGKIEILDPHNFIAMDTQNSVVCQAIDGAGSDVMLQHVISPFEPIHCWELLNATPRPFTLQLQLDPGQSVPRSLSQVDFVVYALYGQPLASFELPFEPMDDWTELLPGFKVFVEKAESKDGECYFVIKQEMLSDSFINGILREDYNSCSSRSRARFYRDIFDLTDYHFVSAMVLIDAQGNPMPGQGSGYHATRGVVKLREDWDQGRIDCSDGIAAIRFNIAVAPYRRAVPLTLTDITILGF